MTTLENSYCVTRTLKKMSEFRKACNDSVGCGSMSGFPNTDSVGYYFMSDEDGFVMHVNKPPMGLTEIPVSRFLDLLNDRIVPWRLEEVGFRHTVRGIYELNVNQHGHFSLEYCDGFVYVSAGRTSITTFTDLLQLIRMLTPKP